MSTAAQPPPAGRGRTPKRGPGATTITLSISREDKRAVKILAAESGKSISELFHVWIGEAEQRKENRTCLEPQP